MSVTVQLIADIKGLQSGLSQAAKLVKNFASTATAPLRLLDRTIKGLFNIRNLVAGGTLAAIVKIGADAEDTENRFSIAFGDMSESVRQWSEDLSARLKRSGTDMRDSAAELQLFLTNAGLAAKEAIAMSEGLTEVSYAVANLRGGNPAETVEAMRSALMGSSRALHRYGVEIDDVAMQQWAVKNGLDANIESWTEQQKIIASTGAIYDAFRRDTAALNKGQESTNTLLGSLKSQITGVAAAVYKEWAPSIKAALAGMRDWLMENQRTIAEWAARLGAYLIYVKDVFVGFVKIMRESPKEGFAVLMQSLVEVMKAAAEIAVDLAIRIGEGIWEGVRKRVMGEHDQEEIAARAMEIYKSHGGITTMERTLVDNPRGLGGGKRVVETEVPIDAMTGASGGKPPYTYADALAKARTESITAPILAGFGTNALQAIEDAGKNIVAGSETFREYTDEAGKNLATALAQIDQQFPDMPQAEQAAQAWGAIWGETFADVSQGAEQLGQAFKNVAGAADTKAQKEFNEKIKELIADYMFEIELLGKSNAERDKARIIQDAINEAARNHVELTEKQKERLENVVDLYQKATKSAQGMTDAMNQFSELGTKAIDGFADALARAIVYGDDLKQSLEDLALDLLYTWLKMYFTNMINMAFTGGGGGGGLGFARGGIVPSFARGGIVPKLAMNGGLVYAQTGYWKPRGTDTVPAMLTPGESVLDRDTTSRLQRILNIQGIGGGSSNREVVGLLQNQLSTTQELLLATKRRLSEPAAVVVVDRREDIAEVMRKNALRQGPIGAR